jgi:hypothetical protein
MGSYAFSLLCIHLLCAWFIFRSLTIGITISLDYKISLWGIQEVSFCLEQLTQIPSDFSDLTANVTSK